MDSKKLETDVAEAVKDNMEGDMQRLDHTKASMPRANFTEVLESVTRTQAPSNPIVPGYEQLSRILGLAYGQAAHGKGRQRHAFNVTGVKPWHQQPILELARMTGPGASAYQVMKKAQEACHMVERGELAAAKAEALGIIVYAAALYKLIEEIEQPTK